MSLNVVSNYAANIAQRNLASSDAQATNSLSKLSSGSRVVSAKDDVAASAIGARLNSMATSLKQASVNAGQAVSMLQIADGSMAKVNDVLTRMKTLAVQAGSGQLSSTERSMLNTEYQALTSEVTRIAAATEFNGQQLVNGSLTTGGSVTTVAASNFGVADGVASITGRGMTTAGSDNYTMTYNNTTHVITMTGPGTESYTGTIDSAAMSSGTGTNSTMITGTAVRLTQTGSTNDVVVELNTAFQAGSNQTASTNNGLRFSGSSSTTFSYKVGAGTDPSKDVISVSIGGINAANLGISGTDITTAANADLASSAITTAIDTLQTLRSTVGAAQNRLEFASANLAAARENTEAARSSLLDLDVAAEMSNFTAKQVLMQAGVSMLAQANQMPQQLMRLFQ